MVQQSAKIKSHITNCNVKLNFVIVPTITSDLPRDNVNIDKFKVSTHIILADPSFAAPDVVGSRDILGSYFYWSDKNDGTPNPHSGKQD